MEPQKTNLCIFFCIIGCVAHVKVVKPYLKRFEACSTPMIVVGSEFRAYRVYNLVSGLVYITRDIVFDETTKWAWLNQNNQSKTSYSEQWFSPNQIGIRNLIEKDDEAQPNTPLVMSSLMLTNSELTQGDGNTTPLGEQTPKNPCSHNVKFVYPPASFERIHDVDYEEEKPPHHWKYSWTSADAWACIEGTSFDTRDFILYCSRWANHVWWSSTTMLLAQDYARGDGVNLQLYLGTHWSSNSTSSHWFKMGFQNKTWCKWLYCQTQSPFSREWVCTKIRNQLQWSLCSCCTNGIYTFVVVRSSTRNMGSTPYERENNIPKRWLTEEVFVVQPPRFVQNGQEHKLYKLYKALYGSKSISPNLVSKLIGTCHAWTKQRYIIAACWSFCGWSCDYRKYTNWNP